MSKLLVRRAERAPRKVEQDVIEVMEPDTEISASGGKARVKSRRASFEDGKLTSEAFEGKLDCSAYEQIVTDAQHQFLAQTALLTKSLSWLLPVSGKHRPRPRLINSKQRCSLCSLRP